MVKGHLIAVKERSAHTHSSLKSCLGLSVYSQGCLQVEGRHWVSKTLTTNAILPNFLPLNNNHQPSWFFRHTKKHTRGGWATHRGLPWIQRRARLKAMFLHSSSDDIISLWRSFWEQPSTQSNVRGGGAPHTHTRTHTHAHDRHAHA